MALMKCCPNLKSMSCDRIIQIETIVKAFECGPTKLQKLHLSGCKWNRNTIMSVASLSNLRELHLNARERFDNLMSHKYTDAFDQGNLINLEVLSLSHCRNLESKGLNTLLKGNLMLKCVKLVYLRNVASYADIFVECNLKHLETFHAIFCPGFQDHDIEVLKRSCPRIRDIVIRL
jgi:Leucine-rich repeat (LRR) protein